MKEGLSYFTDIHLTLFGFALFFAVFLGALIIVYLPNRRNYIAKMEQLPLEND